MDRDRKLSLSVGGFVLLGLVALALAILSLSAEQGLFRTRYRLVAHFENVQGLKSGAAVWLAGSQVGRVDSVEFATSPAGKPGLKVGLLIDEDVKARIRADSVASISTVGLLGDQIIEISLGSTDEAVIPEGAVIASVSPFNLGEMVSKGTEAIEAIRSLAANLDATVGDFRSEEGISKLSHSLTSLEEIVMEIKEGDGMLHSLIYEPYEGTAIASFEGSLDSLESILGKVDSGEGTLGLLLNDPTLFEEMKLLVGGANRSKLVRGLVDLMSEE